MSDIPDLHNICRCCHREGSFKSLRLVYANKNCIEIYGIMIQKTFNITIHPPPFDASYTICDQCILKLRDASCFKLQVLRCEEKLEEFYRSDDFESDTSKEVDDIQINEDASKEISNEEPIKETEPEPVANPLVLEESQPKETPSKNSYVKSVKPPKAKIVKKKRILTKKLIPNLESLVKTDRGDRYRCNTCGTDFNTLAVLRRHTPAKHKDAYKCKQCSTQCANPAQYIAHLKTHSNSTTSSIHQKPSDEKSEVTRGSVKTGKPRPDDKYSKQPGNSKPEKIQCDLCKKFFADKGTLRKHIKRHYGMQKECVCNICGSSFYNRTNMKIHIRTVHEKLRPYKCNVCSKTYTMKAHLKGHYRKHTGERPYKCDNCSRRFDSLLNLKRHKLKMHRDGYNCKICNETLDKKGDFLSHMRGHAGQKEFKCHMCVKDFSSRFALNRHIRYHEAVKSHECDVCGKKFKSTDELKKHKRNVHNPDKVIREKVKCKICKKYFGNMKKHINSHKKRPFSCELCEKSYPERNALNRHVKFAHDGVKFTCTVCDKQYVKKINLKNHTLKEHQIKYKEPKRT